VLLVVIAKPVIREYGEYRRTMPFISITGTEHVDPDSLPRGLILTEDYLAQFEGLPCLASKLENIRQNIPIWNAFIDSAWNQADGLTIDLLMQEHASELTPVSKGIERSQHAIEKILERERYSVVGFEGNDIPKINEASLRTYTRNLMSSLGLSPIEGDVVAITRDYIAQNGGTRYAQRHPDVHLFGCEAESLLSANSCFVYSFKGLRYARGQDPLMDNLVDALEFCRSEMALAKTILELHRLGETRGAIIIGSYHGPAMEGMMKLLRIRGTIYNTAR
jgi:hypothetical protein